jgi:hypothetical protein
VPALVTNKGFPGSVAANLFNPLFLQYAIKDVDDATGPLVFSAPPDLTFTEGLEEQVLTHPF